MIFEQCTATVLANHNDLETVKDNQKSRKLLAQEGN
jgi:hypothetical protein